MDLVLLRHGIPFDPDFWNGTDSTRPLTPLGRDQVGAVIEALSDPMRIGVDEIWSSPLSRCEETASIAAAVLKVPLRISAALTSGSNLLLSLPRLQGDPARWPERLMCVGHQPDLGLLISALVGAPSGSHGLGRCGIARLSGRFSAGGMKLEWLYTAEEALLL